MSAMDPSDWVLYPLLARRIIQRNPYFLGLNWGEATAIASVFRMEEIKNVSSFNVRQYFMVNRLDCEFEYLEYAHHVGTILIHLLLFLT